MRLLTIFLLGLLVGQGATLAQNNNLVSPSAPGHRSTVEAPARGTQVLKDRVERYKVRNGDSLEVQFAFSPEFNQTLWVQPDGYITLKSAGMIVAAGHTLPELTADIERAYAGILHNPVVTIDLKDFQKPYFIVAGQVGKPGKYELRSDFTVTEGVAIAGGFTEASKHSQVILFRPGTNGMTEARLIDVKKMLKSHNLREDIDLHSGDMIFVPQNRYSKISRYLPTSNLGFYGYPGSF
jgi:polysaccharide export outer membrane protein